MSAYFPASNPRNFRKAYPFFLAFFWLFGLCFGVMAFVLADVSFVSLMRSFFDCAVSIFGLLWTILPFLISTAAFFLAAPWLLYLICFVKAFLLSFLTCGICIAFGSAGWLIRTLILFEDLVTAPLLYGYWLYFLSDEGLYKKASTALALSVSLLLCSLEHCFVSPFMVRLINNAL